MARKIPQHLEKAGAEIVATEALIRTEPAARHALTVGLVAWAVPDAMAVAIARPAAVTEPARIAAMLARLPRIPILRGQLRRLAVSLEPRQVLLL